LTQDFITKFLYCYIIYWLYYHSYELDVFSSFSFQIFSVIFIFLVHGHLAGNLCIIKVEASGGGCKSGGGVGVDSQDKWLLS